MSITFIRFFFFLIWRGIIICLKFWTEIHILEVLEWSGIFFRFGTTIWDIRKAINFFICFLASNSKTSCVVLGIKNKKLYAYENYTNNLIYIRFPNWIIFHFLFFILIFFLYSFRKLSSPVYPLKLQAKYHLPSAVWYY